MKRITISKHRLTALCKKAAMLDILQEGFPDEADLLGHCCDKQIKHRTLKMVDKEINEWKKIPHSNGRNYKDSSYVDEFQVVRLQQGIREALGGTSVSIDKLVYGVWERKEQG